MVIATPSKPPRLPYRIRRNGWRRHPARHRCCPGSRTSPSSRPRTSTRTGRAAFGTAVRRRGGRRRRALLAHEPGRRVRLRAAVRPPPRRDVGRGAGGRRRGGAVRREAARHGPGHRRGDRRAAAQAGVPDPGRAITGAAPSRWRAPASCSPTARCGWSPATWWTRCRRCRGGCDRARSGGPVVEQAVHVLDLARVLVGEVRAGAGARAAGPSPGGRRRRRRPPRSCRSSTARSARSAPPACSGQSTAPAGDRRRRPRGRRRRGLAGGPRRRRCPSRAEFDRWTACVAADRAFVDARGGPAGRPADARHPTTTRPCAATGWPRRSRARRLGVRSVDEPPCRTTLAARSAPRPTSRWSSRSRAAPPSARCPAADGPVAVRTRYTGAVRRHRAELPQRHEPGADVVVRPGARPVPHRPARHGLPGGAAGLHGGRRGDRGSRTASGSPSATSSP